MSQRTIPAKKVAYREKLLRYTSEYKSCLLVHVDNIGSNQIQQTRIQLRGKAEVLMGKNTMIRRILRDHLPNNRKLESLLRVVQGNVGFVFTNESIPEIRTIIEENRRPAPAKAGAIAPNNVVVPAGPTGLDPGQTSFFQSLNIATKIVRGQIEIATNVNLIRKGDKVGNSEVSLLSKLNIAPFSYAPKIQMIYDDGSVYSPDILDLTDDDLVAKFFNGVRQVASISLAIGYPTLASLPHTLAGAFQKLLAIAVTTDYSFEEAKDYKEYLADPEAYMAAHGISAAPAAEEKKEEEAAVEEEESDESSEEGGMGGLFGDEDSDF